MFVSRSSQVDGMKDGNTSLCIVLNQCGIRFPMILLSLEGEIGVRMRPGQFMGDMLHIDNSRWVRKFSNDLTFLRLTKVHGSNYGTVLSVLMYEKFMLAWLRFGLINDFL